ncbi:hypothetical protein PIIN_10405, partial [Serendipita indica DSM 11827]
MQQTIDDKQEGWNDLIQRLEDYLASLEERIALFEGCTLKDRIVDEALSPPLLLYVQFLEGMHYDVIQLRERYSHDTICCFRRSRKVKVDAMEILKFKEGIQDQYWRLMEVLQPFITSRVQAAKQKVDTDGSNVPAALNTACLATKRTLEAAYNNQNEWSDLIQRLENYISALEERMTLLKTYPPGDSIVDDALSRPLTNYVEFLENLPNRIVDLKEKLSGKKYVRKIKGDEDEVWGLKRDVEDQYRQFKDALTIASLLSFKVDVFALLELPTVGLATSSIHRPCMQGTREAVLETIWEWANDDTFDKPIFWLCDIAGSGKSSIAMTAVERWQSEEVLGGKFFFSLASSGASTTENFCSTIARELAHHIPKSVPYIVQAVKRNPNVMQSPLDEQFRTFITGPLYERQERVILVIDALDECKSRARRKELVEALSAAVRECKNLKIFMTSRPDPVIEAVLESLSTKVKLQDRLHDTNHHDNTDDITSYVDYSLDGILPEDKRRKLVERANGLFIWASTACEMLNNQDKSRSQEDLYDLLMSVDQAGPIDGVYDLVFERIGRKNYAVLCEILALLLAAFEPLTVDNLDDLLKSVKIQGSAKALVRNLGNVLTSDETTNLIQFRHPTLVEYLQRCTTAPSTGNRDRIYLNVPDAHGKAASWCLQSLGSETEGPKFNICQIESSFYLNSQIPDLDARISKFISRRLRYASSHWLFHVAKTDDNGRRALKMELENATQIPNMLYWAEVLSFTGGVPRAIAGLRAVTHQRGLEENTRSTMTEVRRFLMASLVPIQDSAPHVYISALPFTPRTTKINQESTTKFPNILTLTHGIEEMYHRLSNSLQGHQERVCDVKFSPDDSRIISGSLDKTIRVWDVDTGQALGEPLRGHEGPVFAVGLSPDGSQIVSGSADGTIRLWDVDTGQPLGEPLRGHEGFVFAVEFSPDGSQIVSGSEDKTIR